MKNDRHVPRKSAERADLCAVHPRRQEWVKDSKPGLQNDRIKLVNNLLANMALRKGCYFVNIAEA